MMNNDWQRETPDKWPDAAREIYRLLCVGMRRSLERQLSGQGESRHDDQREGQS